VWRMCFKFIISQIAACICASIFLFPIITLAGWSENVRLTYRGNEIHPQVIARNDTVHVAWNQIYGNVSYIRSTDGGATWDSLVNLTELAHTGSYANLNLAENGVLVTWMDYDEDGLTSIAFATSAEGANWSQPTYVWTENPRRFNFAASAVAGDSIFLAYYSYRDDSTGLSPLRAMHSYDYGHTWSDEITLGHPLSAPWQPIIMGYCSGALIIMYPNLPDSAHGNLYNINAYRSTDAGQSWWGPIWVSPVNEFGSQDACVACNHATGELAAGYMDYRFYQYAFHGDIFASISDDGGLTWPFETMASSPHTAWFPSIDFAQDTLVAVWSDMRYYQDVSHEIVFNRSNDGGVSWTGEYRLTETIEESYSPWVSIDNGRISVVWYENPDGSIPMGIFYKKYTPDGTGINGSGAPADVRFSISAYPNPFNSSTIITYSNLRGGEIRIFDIKGQLIRTFFTGGENEGRIKWDATDASSKKVSSGISFARAQYGSKATESSQRSNTIKLIYLK